LVCLSVVCLEGLKKLSNLHVFGIDVLVEFFTHLSFLYSGVHLATDGTPALGAIAVVGDIEEFFKVRGSGIWLQRPHDLIQISIIVVKTFLVFDSHVTFKFIVV
jgi:hypothetical protein